MLANQEMTREEVRALLKATSSPVEFSATGEHGFRISRFRDGSAAEALRLLRVTKLGGLSRAAFTCCGA